MTGAEYLIKILCHNGLQKITQLEKKIKVR